MTELEKIAEKERTTLFAKNTYNTGNLYGATNKNSLSDGDEKGKGELNGSVGSLTDINTRNENMSKNTYSPLKEYSKSNPNALSDGDEKGKGELNGSVGSLTDINTRNENVLKNKYGNKKTYPDSLK